MNISSIFSAARKTITSYVGDDAFLKGVSSAAANVTAADGQSDDDEVEAATSTSPGASEWPWFSLQA